MIGAIFTVFLIVIVAGVIAYVGDRVGHQVGRKRLTLFGLRPRYTSTIVAVGTGMLIALTVTLAALVASNLVRTAFFRLGTINTRINELQAQQVTLEKELQQTRNSDLRVPKFTLIANTAWTFDLSKSDAAQLPDVARFFDAVVKIANQQLTTDEIGLKAYPGKSTDPEIRGRLLQQLAADRLSDPNPKGQILLLPVASQNLFRGEVISFAFAAYEDKLLAKSGTEMGSVEVVGGTQVDVNALVAKIDHTLLGWGYPVQFINPLLINSTQIQAINAQLPNLSGRYRIVARTPIDVYPHNGLAPIDVSLEPSQ